MTLSAAFPILPLREHNDQESDVLQATAALLSQSLEDLHLTERVDHALRATGYGALRTIDVSVNARIVHLVGRVPSYYLKQIALSTALATPGVHRIHDDLDVIASN